MPTNNSFFTPENLTLKSHTPENLTLKSQTTKWKYRSNIKLFPLRVNFEPLCTQVSTTCRSFHVSQIKSTDGHVNKPPDSVPCPVLIYCYLDNAQLCFDKWKVVLASAQTHAIKMLPLLAVTVSQTCIRAIYSCEWQNTLEYIITSLPVNIRLIDSHPSFRRDLKTHLFNIAFI